MNTQAQALYETLPAAPRDLPLLKIEVHETGEVTMHGILANRSLAVLRELQTQLASWIKTQEQNTWGATVWTGELPSVVAWAAGKAAEQANAPSDWERVEQAVREHGVIALQLAIDRANRALGHTA